MKFSILTILSIASLVLAGVPASKQSATPEYVPDSYIIQFKDTITMSSKGDNAHFDWLNEALSKENHKREAGAPEYGVKSKYQIPGFMGYSGTFSKAMVEEIKKRNEVVDVTQDAIVRTQAPSGLIKRIEKPSSATPEQRPKSGDITLSQRFPCTEQKLPTSEIDGLWGLGRISHMGAPPNTTNTGWGKYVYDRYTGKCPRDSPPTAYVIDSGILPNHPDYVGRGEIGYNHRVGLWPDEDICGHGTHVAGIIGGSVHGVMKAARLVGVKVLEGVNAECSGTWAGVIAGINWAVKDAKMRKALKTSVINMSLGGGSFPPINKAVQAAIDNGMTVVVAGGNGYGADSCEFSPASVVDAITVGSMSINEQVSTYSNGGCCIDIFAPGQNIQSSYLGNGTRLLSGTSMAAPMVAGLVLYNKCRWGYDNPDADRKGLVEKYFSDNGALQDFPVGSFEGCAASADLYNRVAFNRANCF